MISFLVDKFCDETFCICSRGSGYASWIRIRIVDPDMHRGSGFILWTFPLMFRDFLINQRKISFTISVGNLWMERIYSNRIKRSLSGGGEQYDNKSVESIQSCQLLGFIHIAFRISSSLYQFNIFIFTHDLFIIIDIIMICSGWFMKDFRTWEIFIIWNI